ncbi:hypothetical protein QJQ45_025704 [Haematococcus lacustris]|nr:hypothetical protein QJQ45_025704 [Haematococcus lacustris]
MTREPAVKKAEPQLIRNADESDKLLAVANRWDALLPDPRRQQLSSPKHSSAQIVHTDGVAISVMFLRPKPAAPPAELPRMGKHMGAVNPLAHLDAEWLGVDPGKTKMARVAHDERNAAGTAQATKTSLAQLKPQLNALSHVSSKPSSLASYRRFADTVLATYDAMWAEVSKPRWAIAKFRLYCGKQRVLARFWSKLIKHAKQRWPDRILALAYGAAGFNGSGTVGCRGVFVSQMLMEAVKQFGAGRVVLVEEFRTSRVSSAYSSPSEALPGQPPETFRWLDRDTNGCLNLQRIGESMQRPLELCRWKDLEALPLVGEEYQQGYKRVNDRLPKPTSAPWYKPSRRDFIMAGIGSLFGGGAMYVYDTYVIEDLYDEIDDLEDELAFVDEEDMLQKAEANARQFDDNPPAND